MREGHVPLKGACGEPDARPTGTSGSGGDSEKPTSGNTGRALRVDLTLINRGGEKINAEEVEALLVRHPAVAEAALVAMPDPRLGEKARAFVAVRPGHALPTLTDLRDFLNSQGVAKFKWPESVEFLQALPRTTIGKVQKRQLREGLFEPREKGDA